MRAPHGEHAHRAVLLARHLRFLGLHLFAHAQPEQPLLQSLIACELAGRHLLRDAAVDHHADAIGHVDRDAEVLLDQQHRDLALGGQPAQRGHHLLDDDRREPFGGLVHHQQARLEQQGAADRQHLLLAAGKLRAAMALALCQPREHGIDALHVTPPRCHEAQRLVHRERGPHAPPLRDVGDAGASDLVRREAEDLLAREPDAARCLHEAGDGIAQGGLAHAVAPDDGQHAPLQREAHALQRMRAAVVDVESVDGEH